MVNERRWLILILALYFFLAIGYSLIMPPWEAPDEPAHYHLAWHLTHYNRYPSQETNYEAHQPRTYYYLSSLIMSILNKVDPELTRYQRPKEFVFNIRKPEPRFEWNDKTYRFLWGMYVMRWINILFGGVALWLSWQTFKRIAPEKETLGRAALALAALTPLLPFITKLSVLPVSAAVLLIIILNWIFRFTEKRWLLISTFLFLAMMAVLYFLFPEIAQTAVSEIKWRLWSFRENAFTEKHIKFITEQILATYWGKVGWLAVGLPAWIINSLTALGLSGMALHVYALIRHRSTDQRTILWIAVWLIAVFSILAVFRNGLTTRATQGRLLFPAIGALSLFMVAGWHEILPHRLQRFFPGLIVLLFLLLNMILWQTGILPIYYQPFLD
jgi:hypothetical protein